MSWPPRPKPTINVSADGVLCVVTYRATPRIEEVDSIPLAATSVKAAQEEARALGYEVERWVDAYNVGHDIE